MKEVDKVKCFKNGNDCPYRNICSNKTSDGNCYKLCSKFNEIDTLFYNANIPRAYLQPMVLYPDEIDVPAFDVLKAIKDNIVDYVNESVYITISSKNRGNGKTSWAIKILQNYLHNIWYEPGGRTRGLYVDVPEYISELKAGFDSKENEARLFAKDIDRADLVIFDNIDVQRLSEWERSVLTQHIRKRLNNGLSNIYITRDIDTNLKNAVGYDLAYYLCDRSCVLPLLGKGGKLK